MPATHSSAYTRAHLGVVLAPDKVVGLDEDLAKPTLADRVVLQVEPGVLCVTNAPSN